MSVPPAQYHILAGKTAGTKVVTHDRRIVGAHRALVNMARSGNHWARLCVNYINALTSRKMPTVFVREGAKTPDNRQIYVLLVPGLRMEFSQHANSDFVIHGLALDEGYSELQKNYKKPGLFRVKRENNQLKASLVDQVLADKGRVVAISDRYSGLTDAMVDSARAAKEPIGNSVIDRFGFDMHYTPGESRIGGLLQKGARRPELNTAIRESAILLANTMEASRGIPGVYWVSQAGGSGVLTHALHILKRRKVTFDNSGHHVFFSGPTTNLVRAQQLAYDLNLKFERKAYSLGMYTNISDVLKAPWQRHQRDSKNYSRLQMGIDMCKGAPQLLIGGVAIGSSFGLGGMGAFIVGAGVAGFTAIAAITGAVAPNVHDKMKGKL